MKNIVFGTKVEDSKAIEDAIFAAHKYRNKLCEIELRRRAAYHELLREYCPDVVRLEAEANRLTELIEENQATIRQQRMEQRTKTPKGEVVRSARSAVKDIQAERKEVYANLESARIQARENEFFVAADQSLQSDAKEWLSEAKRDSGLYWATEGVVKMFCREFSSGPPPSFKRYDGEGQIAVQYQGGLPSSDIGIPNTLIYFGEQMGSRIECFFRVASDERKNPIFARLLVKNHREIEPGKIKWAYIEKRMAADNVRWKLRLTVDEDRKPQIPHDDSRWVAVHFGWAMQHNGLRSATWHGFDGSRGAVVLDKCHLADYDKLDQIRSEIDRTFNEAIELLRVFASKRKGNENPEWFAESMPHFGKWRSFRRFMRFMLRWRDDRFDGDESAFASLWELHKEIKHRWQHRERLSLRVAKRREHQYRCFVRDLQKRYEVVFLAHVDTKELNENSSPEDLERDNTKSHRHSKWAAVATLEGFIRERYALATVAVNSKNLTRQCANCGELNVVKRRSVQCRGCGNTWDVDENAIANTITRGESAVKSGALLESKQRQDGKDERAKEKLAKMHEGARVARKRKLESAEMPVKKR